MSNKEIIIDKAIELFNKCGVDKITTNHIARSCGISPGNLYYHFKNKEEIIRVIYDRISDEFAKVINITIEKGVIEEKFRIFEQTFIIQNKYIFFIRDLYLLLKNDSVLKKKYDDFGVIKSEMIRKILNYFVENNYIEPLSDEEKNMLIEQLQFINGFWMSYLNITREIDIKRDLFNGFYMSYKLMESSLTEDGKQHWNNALLKLKKKFEMND